MKTKIIIILLAIIMSLSPSVRAVEITFHTTEPTPGPYDVYNFVGAATDSDNVGTTTRDGATNDATTYVAYDRGSQGQFFVTGDSEPVYQVAGFWYQHCGYTENTNQTYWNLTANNTITVRVTFPPASGTEDFIMRSETYTITGEETDNIGVGPSSNGTGTWIHAVFDTPVPVGPGVTYGIDMTAASGGFYETLGIKDTAASGNPYPDGTAYVSGAAGEPSDTYTIAPGDRVFIVELIAVVPLKASAPNPENAADNVSQNPNLTWVPGQRAAEHVVYFGDDYNDVAAGIGDTYKGIVTEPSYNVSSLTVGQTYYWRIDEVNGPDTWTGDIWSFKIAPTKAWNPSPYNYEVAVFTDPCTTLSWNPSAEASESQLYFGTSPDSLTLETTISHTGLSRYSYSKTGLANDQDYYWRVDQISDSNTMAGDVWNFKTIPIIPVSDPNLVGWWKFDEGPGKAIDFSGLGQHGTVYGGAQTGPGYDGDAMQFDGFDDIIDLPIGSTIAASDSISIMTWINFSGEGGTDQRIFDFGNSSESGYFYLTPDNGSNMILNITSDAGTASQIDAPILQTGWHHVAALIDSATMNLQLYLDSESIAFGTTGTLPSDLGSTTNNWIGRSQWGAQAYLDASLDDFRIYNYALTADEINTVMQIDPLRARKPSPQDGSTPDIITATPLSWTPGIQAVQNDVYFGTDAKVVADADTSTADIYRGRQDSNSYTPPEDIEYNQTYYWRIDGVGTDATVSVGYVWAFTVADYLLVDDFESYNDINTDQEGSKRIFLTWVDGYENPSANGSTIGYPDPIFADGEHFVETDIVHGGDQSAPLLFDNSTASVSEVSVSASDLSIGSDWTVGTADTLSLWVYGDPNNPATEQMYVKINDAKVVISDVDFTLAAWQEVTIDLAAFNTNLSNVTTFVIGIERTGATGGSGMVFIDDIRLYW